MTIDPDADSARFEALFDRHAAELLRFCFRRTADAALAEDLVWIVFLEAWRARHKLRGDADAVMAVRHRDERRAPAVALAASPRRGAGAHRPAATAGESAAEVVAREHEMRATLQSIARLPRRDQDILALCVWSELSYEQAARVLGVPVGTVRSRLSRARRRLREDVAPDNQLSPRPEGNAR